MIEKLKETIEQTQKIIVQNECKGEYKELANIMLDNRSLLQQLYKSCKQYEYLDFHLIPVTTIPPTIFIITVKYLGQAIATISITKDKQVQITTEQFDENNKKDFSCDIKLKSETIDSEKTKEFMEYFRENIVKKTKTNEKAKIESLLMTEFSKTSSVDKLLLGIQTIKFENFLFPMPTTIRPNSSIMDNINIFTRSKIRKITIIELLSEDQTPETVLANATSKAVFLLNLLHSEQGQQWYKIFGFHGRVTPHLTVKVCIAVPKNLKSKCKEFEPFELRAGTDSIEYHYMAYDTDGTKITKIDTTLNN